jgi:hypothetical protein
MILLYIPLQSIDLKECNAEDNRYLHTYVYSSAIHTSQICNQSECPITDEWIKKMEYKYTMEYLFSHKEE